jgi:hypothetical protein
MKPDFDNMTKNELRAYLVAHPHERAAFYAFVDRFTSEASTETFALPKSQAEIAEIHTLIEQKVKQQKL